MKFRVEVVVEDDTGREMKRVAVMEKHAGIRASPRMNPFMLAPPEQRLPTVWASPSETARLCLLSGLNLMPAF
jgi:hypothetical protein